MHFRGLKKSPILGKTAEVMEKSWNFFFFGPNTLFYLKNGNIFLVFEQKFVFSIF